jgi:DNA-binding response OmpR family regulator
MLLRAHSTLTDGEVSVPPGRLSVLVIEDDAIVGFDLVEALSEAGLKAIGPLTSRAAALEWLETNTPEAAVLDLMLEDGSAEGVAQVLKTRGIPFIAFSAGPLEQDLANVLCIEKPVPSPLVVRTLLTFVGSRPSPKSE